MSCVYFLRVTTKERFGGQTIYKIGMSRSDNPHSRSRTIFDTFVPFVERIDIVYYMICKDDKNAYALERYIHDVFVDVRIDGECYDLPEHIVSLISRSTCMYVSPNTIRSFREDVSEEMFIDIVTNADDSSDIAMEIPPRKYIRQRPLSGSSKHRGLTPEDIVDIRKSYLSAGPDVDMDEFIEEMYDKFGAFRMTIRSAALTTAWDSFIQRGVGVTSKKVV